MSNIDKFKSLSVKGLGLIPGTVGRFDSSNGFRVPHIGWNAVQVSKDAGILDDICDRHVYFVHSYRAIPVCSFYIFLQINGLYFSVVFILTYVIYLFMSWQSEANREWISSTCNYGEDFIASISRGNIHAVQFHPEKSGGKSFCAHWDSLSSCLMF